MPLHHRHTLVASLVQNTLRISVELPQINPIYASPPYRTENIPQSLASLFEGSHGLYQYLLKCGKEHPDRLAFRQGNLAIKVPIDDRIREINLKLRCMHQDA